MDEESEVEAECQEKFLDLFDSMVKEGLPVMMVTRAFLSTAMSAFRIYIADDDLTRIPVLLRRYASTIERNTAGRNLH